MFQKFKIKASLLLFTFFGLFLEFFLIHNDGLSVCLSSDWLANANPRCQ